MDTSASSAPKRARRLVSALATVALFIATTALPAAAAGEATDPYLAGLTTSTGVLRNETGASWGFASTATTYTVYESPSTSDLLPYATTSVTFSFTRANPSQTIYYWFDSGCSRAGCADIGSAGSPVSLSGSSLGVTLRAHDADAADDILYVKVYSQDLSADVTYGFTFRRDDPSTVSTVATQTCSYIDYSMSAGEAASCSTDLAIAGWDVGAADSSAELVVDNSTEGIAFSVIPTGPGATMTYYWNGSYRGALGSGSSTGTLDLSRTGASLNVLQVRVAAQSYGETGEYTDYFVEVQRLTSSSDSRLSDLEYREGSSSANGGLAPSFNGSTLNYTGTTLIAGSTFQLWIDKGPTQTVTASVNGAGAVSIADTTWTSLGTLNSGSNQVKVTVTGTTTTTVYTLVLSRGSVPAAPYLSALSASAAVFTPSFSPTTFAYSTVATTSTSTTVTATTSAFNATVSYSTNAGASYTSLGVGGGTTSSIALNPGANVVLIKVTAPTNTVGNVYSLTINRTTPNNANLASLVVSSGVLSPAFASTTMAYRVTVPEYVATFSVTPTLSDVSATMVVRVNQGPWYSMVSGYASLPLAISKGINIVEIKITAADAVTTKTYTLTVVRGSKVAVPDVRGKRLAVAKQMLRAAGFRWTVTYVDSALTPFTVINYWPKANRYPGFVIKLRVAR